MTRIRPEAPADERAVQALIAAAFAPADHDGGPVVEEVLNDALRRDPDWIARWSLVAEADGRSAARVIVGQVTASYGVLEHPDPAVPDRRIVAVGPVAVLPSRQRTGIGSELLRAVIEGADAAGEPMIVLLGSPDFYGRFGFVAASTVGIESPDPAWGRYFQVRTLSAHDAGMIGRFRYPAPFQGLKQPPGQDCPGPHWAR
jgi:putative acetyltransferase